MALNGHDLSRKMSHNQPVRLPLLTMEALDDPDDWEPALTFPFPPNPDIALLLKARDRVIEFLQVVPKELAQDGDLKQAAGEMHNAAARLGEIAALIPDAEKADLEESLQVAARFVTTTKARSLKGFRRLEDYHLEERRPEGPRPKNRPDLEARR